MESIDYRDILKLMLLDKYKLFIAFLFFSIASVIYALSLPNVYTSKIVVRSAMDEGKQLSSSLGGLASMAGISVGGGEMSPEVVKESLTSNSFLGSFVKNKNLGSVLFAAESYNSASDEFIYDNTIYDPNLEKWTRKVNYPQKIEPAQDELAKKFKESLTVNFDRKTKLISITFTSFSPTFSKDTLESLVLAFNLYMKNKDRDEANNTIHYLKGKLNSESVSEVRLALQQLLEEQLKKLALAETRAEYALKILDEPLEASLKSGPKRSIICIAITFMGTLLCALILLSIRIFRLER